jgi:RNA polymerase sigma factor (sigma-70 family)
MISSPAFTNCKNIHYTDEELVALFIQTGQNYYFGLLYVKCSKRVYRQCLFLVKDPGLSQDLTHDIFLKLVSGLASFKGKSRFSTWLSRVTHNHCMDQLDSRKRKPEIPFDDSFEIADDLDLMNSFERDSMDMVHLNTSLTNLTSKERAIFLMRYTDNVSIADIAVMFKMSVSAVKMRLLRSRKKLQTSYSACILSTENELPAYCGKY